MVGSAFKASESLAHVYGFGGQRHELLESKTDFAKESRQENEKEHVRSNSQSLILSHVRKGESSLLQRQESGEKNEIYTQVKLL